MQRALWIIFFFSLVLLSCEETVLLDLDQSPRQVIIEGFVSNLPGKQFVRVTKSIDFYQTGSPEGVVNASVTVRDDQGQNFIFVHNPSGKPEQNGYYYPSVDFTGVSGHKYYLEVQVDNQVYTAEDILHPVTKFDSITFQLNKDQLDDPIDEGKFYELLLYAKEPQQTKDYYLFKFYRNDTIVKLFESDIYFTDDVLLGERIDGLPSPVYYGEADTARIEMLSISREAYLFYNDLFNLINNDGGMFGPPPANPRTNLSNGALGYFQASSVEADTLVINNN